MKKIIIDPGIIPSQYIVQAIKACDCKVTLVGGDSIIEKYITLLPSNNCYNYSCFKKNKPIKHHKGVSEFYNAVFNNVVSDYKTLQIAERTTNRLMPWDNEFSGLLLISDLISNYIDFLIEEKPSWLFFQATPHEICSWTLGKVAETMGIKVYMAITTPLPWKSFVTEGLSSPRLIHCENLSNQECNKKLVDEYIIQNSSNYDEAIPSYEKERLEARKGKYWSWKKEIKDNIKSPKLLVAMFRKYSLFRYYQKKSVTSIDIEKKYVVVFLHYQPERTSLPEGRFFTQQYNLIKTLRYGLPDNYMIYVKEHPSMFTCYMDIRYRNKEFYSRVSSLPNVELVNIGIDSFTLTDHSVAIATITGTVGLQSFIRGKSVLCFGDASYVDFDYCFNINFSEDVASALRIIEKTNNREITEKFKEYLYAIDKVSLSGIEESTNCPIDYYNQEYRLISNGKVLLYLLTNP